MNSSATFRPKLILVLAVLSAAGAASCGEGGDGGGSPVEPNRAPVAAGVIPPQTMIMGESASVNVSSYFNDPDGDVLTYAATTSSAAVAGVSVSGSTVTIAGVAPGTATVTVTARDPGGLEATLGVGVTVEAANQAPVILSQIPPQTATVGDTLALDASVAFSDPDGDELSFGATTSDAGVATVSVMGSVVIAAAVAQGTATLTVTATDPGGRSATLSVQVTVANAGAGFRDDFVPGSLSDWQIEEGTRAEISEGVLRVTKVTDSGAGVFRLLESPITSWETRIRLARAEAGGGDVCVALGVSDQRYRSYLLDIGPAFTYGGERFNYFFGLLDDRSNLHDDIAAFGYSEAIRGGAGEFTEITIALKDGRLSGHAGAAELFAFQLSDRLPTDLNAVAFSMACAGIWEASPGRTALFDWIEVGGERSNRANHPPETVGSIPDQMVPAGQTVTIDASAYFSDRDGDWLSYAATTTDAAIASPSMSGSILTIEGVWPGTATVTVSAKDPIATATQNISVNVNMGADRDALVALYEATGGDFFWTLDTNWLTDQPLGSWHGVTTDSDGRVVELSLPDNGMWGSIPREIAFLQKLKRLDLSDNRLNEALPPEIGGLRDLERLDLSDNTFLGSGQNSMPAALGNLGKLEWLDLSGTWVAGPIPPEFGKLTNLKHLNVSDSRLEGAIPQDLINVPLELFHWYQTSLCAPGNADFQAWLGSISDHRSGSTCASSSQLARAPR